MKKVMIVLAIMSLAENMLFGMEGKEGAQKREAFSSEKERGEYLRYLGELPRELREGIVVDFLHSEVADRYELFNRIEAGFPINAVALSPDGKTVLAALSHGGGGVKLFDSETGKELRTFPHFNVLSVAFSPDGKTVLTGSWDKTARLWDVETGQELKQFSGHSDWIYSVAFSPDGQTILTGAKDGTALLSDIKTGTVLKRFESDSITIVFSVAFSPDGKTILTGDYKTAVVWDIKTGEPLLWLEGHTGWVPSVALSPDGKTVLTGSWDGTVRLWDAVTGKELQKLMDLNDEVSSVAFNPRGKTVLAAVGDKAWLLDVETGKELQQLNGHTGDIPSVAFNSTGSLIALGSRDTTLSLWKLTSTLTPEQKEKAYKLFIDKGLYNISRGPSQEASQ